MTAWACGTDESEMRADAYIQRQGNYAILMKNKALVIVRRDRRRCHFAAPQKIDSLGNKQAEILFALHRRWSIF
jgi:hypothetical protein